MHLTKTLGQNRVISKPVSRHSKYNIGENRKYILQTVTQGNATHGKSTTVGRALGSWSYYDKQYIEYLQFTLLQVLGVATGFRYKASFHGKEKTKNRTDYINFSVSRFPLAHN